MCCVCAGGCAGVCERRGKLKQPRETETDKREQERESKREREREREALSHVLYDLCEFVMCKRIFGGGPDL
jgi:hypothetical protein